MNNLVSLHFIAMISIDYKITNFSLNLYGYTAYMYVLVNHLRMLSRKKSGAQNGGQLR